MTWAAVLVKNAHKIPYIHIHAYTYRYIPYIHIHTYTYTYSPPSNRVGWGFAGGAAAAQDPAARNSPPRSARMGLDARLPYANSVGGDHWWRRVKRRVNMCMYVYVLHVCNVIHTDTYTYMYIHANTYTYIHIHTPHNQCHEGVLGCCCCRTRLLCAAPPTQIC